MKILHTSDWHLGKHLEGHSRLDEQEKFTEELINIVEENDIDLIIIAGDIYDTSNPPARAEKLFYNTVKRLSNGGKRGVLVIAGNHDNPERLSAASPLAYEHGVILLGTPKSMAECGKYQGFSIIDSGEGFVEIQKNDENIVLITLPYPSEKRLNEIFTNSLEESERQVSYSERIEEILNDLSQKYREDTINMLVSHLFVVGGEESDSERPIQLGGSLGVYTNHLPDNAQYIALGHLHKPQKMKNKNIYYSGSPIQYSKSEINYAKCVFLVDIKCNKKPDVKEIYLKNYKPIEVFKCENIEDAILKCEENKERDIWAYFEIKTDRVLNQSEIKKMKELIPDIIEIKPIIGDFIEDEIAADYDLNERSMTELFKDFYISTRKLNPTDELMDMFLDIVKEEGDENETN